MSKILLVDDDVDLAELVETKLNSEGHEVFSTNTGDGAFELAKKVKPDIALLDIMLPGVTGYQICRKIRKDPELYTMAVLILTALGEEPEVLHGLEQGADDYIVKPFKLEKLIEKLGFLDGLIESIARKNPVTGLPGIDAIKREINHRLAREVAIAVCYIDLVNFKPFHAVKGREGRKNVLTFMSKLLQTLTRSIGVYESFTAHIGGEHFVVLLSNEDSERFCGALIKAFDHEVKDLYTEEETGKGFITAVDKQGREGQYPIMTLSIGVANNATREYRSANKMFEVLAQIRQKSKPGAQSAFFVDRRHTDR